MKKIFLQLALFLLILNVAQAQDTATQYALFPGADVYLPLGGHATIMIVKRSGSLDAFQQLPVNLSNQWTVNGKEYDKQEVKFGKLSLQPMSTNIANYEAPAVPPGKDPVLIAVEFSAHDVDAKSNDKTKNILLCRVHLIDAPNFFFLANGNNQAGNIYELREPINRDNRFSEVAVYGRGQWNISISGVNKEMKPMSIALSFNGNAKGSYEWNAHGTKETGFVPPATIVSVSSMATDGSPFQYVSTDCTPHGNVEDCDMHTLKGSVTITVFDEKDKIIKGYFYGQVLSGTLQYEFISGGFRAYMH